MSDITINTHHRELAAWVNAVLTECAQRGIPIGNLKLQKLLYISYGIFTKHTGYTLSYLNFEAWKYGPVIRRVYDEYKSYNNISVLTQKMEHGGKYPRLIGDDSMTYAIDNYANLSESMLIDITHKEGGAWYNAYKKGVNTPLDHEEIKKDFAHE